MKALRFLVDNRPTPAVRGKSARRNTKEPLTATFPSSPNSRASAGDVHTTVNSSISSDIELDPKDVELRQRLGWQCEIVGSLFSYIETVPQAFESLLQAHLGLQEVGISVTNQQAPDTTPLLDRLQEADAVIAEAVAAVREPLKTIRGTLQACYEDLTSADTAMREVKHYTSKVDALASNSVSQSKKRDGSANRVNRNREKMQHWADVANVRQARARDILQACMARQDLLMKSARDAICAVVQAFGLASGCRPTVQCEPAEDETNGPIEALVFSFKITPQHLQPSLQEPSEDDRKDLDELRCKAEPKLVQTSANHSQASPSHGAVSSSSPGGRPLTTQEAPQQTLAALVPQDVSSSAEAVEQSSARRPDMPAAAGVPALQLPRPPDEMAGFSPVVFPARTEEACALEQQKASLPLPAAVSEPDGTCAPFEIPASESELSGKGKSMADELEAYGEGMHHFRSEAATHSVEHASADVPSSGDASSSAVDVHGQVSRDNQSSAPPPSVDVQRTRNAEDSSLAGLQSSAASPPCVVAPEQQVTRGNSLQVADETRSVTLGRKISQVEVLAPFRGVQSFKDVPHPIPVGATTSAGKDCCQAQTMQSSATTSHQNSDFSFQQVHRENTWEREVKCFEDVEYANSSGNSRERTHSARGKRDYLSTRSTNSHRSSGRAIRMTPIPVRRPSREPCRKVS